MDEPSTRTLFILRRKRFGLVLRLSVIGGLVLCLCIVGAILLFG